MIKTVYECDICGSERREVNHWFVATPVDDEGMAIFPWSAMPNSKDKKAKHLCGQACVHSFVDGFLSKTLPTPEPAPFVIPLSTVTAGEVDDIPW